MATVTTLAAELQLIKLDLQQLRGHMDQQNALQSETSAQQTTKTMTLDSELRSLHENAETVIRAINVDLAAMKDKRARSEKEERSLANKQRYDTECHDEKKKWKQL